MVQRSSNLIVSNRRSRLLAAVALLTIGSLSISWWGWSTGRVHGLWYRRTGDPQSLDVALFRGVANGDTVEKIESLLGPGFVVTASDELARAVRARKQMISRGDPSMTSGYRDGDMFMEWKYGIATYQFQFRDGRIINFDPEEFRDPAPVALLGAP